MGKKSVRQTDFDNQTLFRGNGEDTKSIILNFIARAIDSNSLYRT